MTEKSVLKCSRIEGMRAIVFSLPRTKNAVVRPSASIDEDEMTHTEESSFSTGFPSQGERI
jgi:hypothetical protein